MRLARDILRELRRIQMEIFGQDWPEELPGWESLAGETVLVSRSAVTQQLDSLMKTQGHAAKAKPPVSLDFTGLGRRFSAGNGFGAFCRHRTVFTRRCKIESRRFSRIS